MTLDRVPLTVRGFDIRATALISAIKSVSRIESEEESKGTSMKATYRPTLR